MGYYLDWMIPCFDRLMKKGLLKDAMAQLGTQQLFGSTRFGNKVYNHPKEIFKERYGIYSYTDFDMNNEAMVYLDLTIPLSDNYNEKYNTIVDSGTIEHIFDQKAAFTNFYSMCTIGGHIIHIQGIRNIWNHSFYAYSPYTFWKIAQSNGYIIKHTAFIYTMDAIKRACTEEFQDMKYISGRENPFLDYPLELAFVIVMEKTSNKAFITPSDIDLKKNGRKKDSI